MFPGVYEWLSTLVPRTPVADDQGDRQQEASRPRGITAGGLTLEPACPCGLPNNSVSGRAGSESGSTVPGRRAGKKRLCSTRGDSARGNSSSQGAGDQPGFQITGFNAESLLLRIKQEATEPATLIKPDTTAPGKVVIYGPAGVGKTTLLNSLISRFAPDIPHFPESDMESLEQANRVVLEVAGRRVVVMEPAVCYETLTADDFILVRQGLEQQQAAVTKRTKQYRFALEIYRQLADADRILICCTLGDTFSKSHREQLEQLLVCLYSGADGLRQNLRKVRFVMGRLAFGEADRIASKSKLTSEQYLQYRTQGWLGVVNGAVCNRGYGLKFDDSCISLVNSHYDDPCRARTMALQQLVMGKAPAR